MANAPSIAVRVPADCRLACRFDRSPPEGPRRKTGLCIPIFGYTAHVAVQPPRLTAKGRATRERIVAVAAGLMHEHGVGGTSIEDVRRAAGVSGSQITHYFTDKHSLVRAVIAWQADTVIELHRQPALGKLDSFGALRLWADLHVERQKET